MPRVCGVWLLSLLTLSPSLFAEGQLEELMDTFSKKELDIAQPARDLEIKYREHLQRFREDYQAKGNLKAVIAVDEEMKSPGRSGDLQAFPELFKFQETFNRQSVKLEQQAKKELSELMKFYRSNLSRLQIELTQSGKIEEAKLVLAESERTATIAKEWEMALLLPPAGEPIILEAMEIINELAEPDPDRTTYIIESDGTKGILHLGFRHPLLSSQLYRISKASLVLPVADVRSADTSDVIQVFVEGHEVGSKEGAEKGGKVDIEINLQDSSPAESEALTLTIQCGTNALMLEKNPEAKPMLSIEFTKQR